MLFALAFRAEAETRLEAILANSRYNDQEKKSIAEVFASAEQNGMHEELLIPRVQEAHAKRVPSERLIGALAGEIQRLEKARTLLMEVDTGRDILLDDAGWLRTANLIAWDATHDEIIALVTASGTDIEKYLQSSYLFSSLIQWGLSRSDSIAISVATAVSALETDEYPAILDILIQARRLRLDIDDVARRILTSIPEADKIKVLKRKVLYD